jgi:glycosyltransferase 2 family protein
MRSHFRTVLVVVLALGLLALFLYNVELGGVVRAIIHARPEWLALSLASMYLNLAIRSWRWQFLLQPLGKASFANSFRATTVGFAARSILPAAAGELVRPYFLSRHEPMSATGAFATIVIERLLDLITVLILLASYVFVFGRQLSDANPTAVAAVKWAGGIAGAGALAALGVLFLMAGNPERLAAMFARLEQVVPSALAGLIARIAEKFARGLGAIRRPEQLLATLAASFPLWLSIGLGIWAVTRAFDLDVPFTGSFLFIALLTIGITIPTPGAIGSFHEAFRIGATLFFGAPDDVAVGAAIMLHAISIGSSFFLGLFFAAQEGLNLAGIRRLADEAEAGRTG